METKQLNSIEEELREKEEELAKLGGPVASPSLPPVPWMPSPRGRGRSGERKRKLEKMKETDTPTSNSKTSMDVDDEDDDESDEDTLPQSKGGLPEKKKQCVE